jgi:hypothetical protein
MKKIEAIEAAEKHFARAAFIAGAIAELVALQAIDLIIIAKRRSIRFAVLQDAKGRALREALRERDLFKFDLPVLSLEIFRPKGLLSRIPDDQSQQARDYSLVPDAAHHNFTLSRLAVYVKLYKKFRQMSTGKYKNFSRCNRQ